MGKNETSPPVSWRGYAGMAVYLLVMPASLFLAAGTIAWPMGWLYIGLLIAVTFLSRLVAWRRHPDLLAELDGYREYQLKTRYRLVPGLW